MHCFPLLRRWMVVQNLFEAVRKVVLHGSPNSSHVRVFASATAAAALRLGLPVPACCLRSPTGQKGPIGLLQFDSIPHRRGSEAKAKTVLLVCHCVTQLVYPECHDCSAPQLCSLTQPQSLISLTQARSCGSFTTSTKRCQEDAIATPLSAATRQSPTAGQEEAIATPPSAGTRQRTAGGPGDAFSTLQSAKYSHMAARPQSGVEHRDIAPSNVWPVHKLGNSLKHQLVGLAILLFEGNHGVSKGIPGVAV
ncbi:hypothetical protein N1851_013874 [Merluccius polli]|uniref:Uncharacterized protein n=1 Tax=Merluccius polli TaxID=89951 RepID=A0AA47MUD1_MERPO|nr:hypothetical protein N1851_013874 [Merluccius polli]